MGNVDDQSEKQSSSCWAFNLCFPRKFKGIAQMYLFLRNLIPHNVNALTVSMTVAMIKLMSSPVLQLNKEIALPDILGIPKYDNAAISSRKMDLSYSGETMSKKCFGWQLYYKPLYPPLVRLSVTDDCHFGHIE